MGAAASAAFPQNVAVGQTVDISINMTAPTTAGSYRGFWMFKNASGALFGIGPQANKPWWVDIKVSGTGVTPGATTPAPTTNVAYDFATNACAGTWFSGAGQLTCPGTDGDAKGFVLKISNPKLENGTTDTRPGILTFPQNIQDGYIQGFFPAFRVQNGDRFRSIINCEGGATNCYVSFSLDYTTGTDPTIKSIGRPFPFGERYEGNFFAADVDLSFLAGKDVKFILTVRAAGTAVGDRALWVGPIIYRVGASAVTPAATTAVPTTPTTPVATTPVATTAVATTAVATTAVATTAVPTTAVPPTTAVATTPVTPAAAAFQNVKYDFKFSLPEMTQ